MAVTPAKVQSWVDIAVLIATRGIASWSQIQGFIKSVDPSITDAELNQIVQGVRENAKKRVALAESEIAKVDALLASEQ